jgi:hypothetical protein
LKASSKRQSKSGLRKKCLEPQNVSNSVWYYEEDRHLNFVVRTNDFDTSKIVSVDGGTIQFNVPLRMLEKSLLRMPKSKIAKMIDEANHLAWEEDKHWRAPHVGD